MPPSKVPLPAFIATPLQNKIAFVGIDRQLATREAKRLTSARESRAGGNNEERNPFGITVGTSEEHSHKNRYSDIVAYDSTRVVFPQNTEAGTPRYVNASLLQSPPPETGIQPRWWLAAQAPLPHTLYDFFSLLLLPPSSLAHPSPGIPPPSLIVQLTSLVEGGRRKGHEYFPASVGDQMLLRSEQGEDMLRVSLLSKEPKSDGKRVSFLEVERPSTGERKKIIHVEYLGWPDHGCPENPSHLMSFIQSMDALNSSLHPSASVPILVHCSAGVGRTGVYLTLASLLPLLSKTDATTSPIPTPTPPTRENGSLSSQLSPYPIDHTRGLRDLVGLTVDGLRNQRCLMVQNSQQLRFIFEALEEEWELIHQGKAA